METYKVVIRIVKYETFFTEVEKCDNIREKINSKAYAMGYDPDDIIKFEKEV